MNRLLRPAFVIVMALAVLSRLPAAAADSRQYYELRVYTTSSTNQQQRINDYWQHAAIPAYNRLGIRPVGVFTEQADSPTNSLYVFIPYDSLEQFGTLPGQLAADPAYQQAAAGFLNAPKFNPPYERFESSLLAAFDGMKHMVAPDPNAKPNIFELRTYLSPSEGKGLNKIHMFESGEIKVMKAVGLAPIFYGRTIAGLHQPCLVYMTCGETPAAHQQHWQGFNTSPVWKQLQADPQFQGNVLKAIRLLLKRTPASQL